MRGFLRSAALAALLCGVATPALAVSSSDFASCDGYGVPTSNGDGMTKEATGLFGLFGPLGSAGNTRRVTPALGQAGIKACDDALADPRLLEKFWLRRASLLRARALHDLAAGNADQALTDLDGAEHALKTPDDPYIRRSMGLGIKLVRAYALHTKGDLQRARRLVESVWAERRYNRQVGLATLMILHDTNAAINGQSVTSAIAALAPRMLDAMSIGAFNRGDFAQVVRLEPQLAEPTKTLDVGISRDQLAVETLANDKRALATIVDRGGHLAYALAALGRPDAARAALSDTEKRLAGQTPAPTPPLAPGEIESGKAGRARATNAILISTSEQERHALDVWHGLIDLRIAAPTMAGPALADQFLKLRPPPGGAALDMLRTISAKMPSDSAIAKVITTLDTRLNDAGPPSAADLKILFEALPHSEIGQRIATYRKANSDFIGYLWGGVSGFKTTQRPDGLTTVAFTGERSSAAVVEEMALLRAADLAREKGKTGIVIRARRDYERTRNTTYYGAVLRSDPTGYSCELDVEFVDRAAPPDRYKETPWRILPVDDVIANLAPAYLAPAERKPPA